MHRRRIEGWPGRRGGPVAGELPDAHRAGVLDRPAGDALRGDPDPGLAVHGGHHPDAVQPEAVGDAVAEPAEALPEAVAQEAHAVSEHAAA
jgi:hypothetical protein